MLRQLLFVSAAIGALSVGACNKPANDTKGAVTPSEQAAVPDAHPAATIPMPANEALAKEFVPKAVASDMFEIAAAKVAEKRSTNPEVKKFARMMVTDHTKSSAALKKAISDSSQTIAAPTIIPQDLQVKLDDLINANGPTSFEKKYMSGQVDAHQDALNLLQRFAQDGDVPAIKAFAAATAPVVQSHLDQAKALRDALK
jgi:putative membrane protein